MVGFTFAELAAIADAPLCGLTVPAERVAIEQRLHI